MKTVDIKIGGPGDDGRHICNGRIDGEWVVFTCPKCPGYERRINQRTDEMTVSWGVGGHVQHSGVYFQKPSEMN